MVTKSLSCLGPLCLALVAAFSLLVVSASAEVTGPVAGTGSAASTETTPVAQGTEQGEGTGVGVPVAGSATGGAPPAAAETLPPASQPTPAPVAGETPPATQPASPPAQPPPPAAEPGPPPSQSTPPTPPKEEVPTPVALEAPTTPKVDEHVAEATTGTSATGSPPSAPAPRAAEPPYEGPVWFATTPQELPQLGASPVEGAGPSGGPGGPSPPAPRKASAQWPAQLGGELSALGLPMTGGPNTPWLSAQPLLAATPARLATEADLLENGPAGAGGVDGHSGSGAPPVTPGPGPAPGGAAGGASGGSGGIALSGLLPLAGLLLLAGPRAIRRLRLSCPPLLTSCFALIPERPG